MRTQIDGQILNTILCRYGVDRSAIFSIGGCENKVFQITLHSSPYILRLTPSSHRSYAMVKAEIEWINYLYDCGLRVARAISFEGCEIVEIVEYGDTYISAVVFEKAPGYSKGYDSLEPEFIQQWGKILGKMHFLARNYHPSHSTYSRARWDQDIKFDIERYVPRSQNVVHEKFQSLVTRLHKMPLSDISYGLIHADLNPDNFFVDEQGITVFDFDDSLYCWFLYDIVAIMFAVIENCPHIKDRRTFAQKFLGFFFDGYSITNSLQSLALNAWSDMLKLQEFERYITLHRIPDLGQTDASEHQRLRYNIENDIPYLDMSFL